MTDSPFRTPTGTTVPAVTAAEMAHIDDIAVDEVGIQLVQMMENAGRTLAWHVRDLGHGPVLVIAGGGGNGGGGLACARHLLNRNVSVDIVLDRDPATLSGATAEQYRILQEMGQSTYRDLRSAADNSPYTVVVDSLIGYGLDGDVREPARTIIDSILAMDAPIVSLDVPSGLDATTGERSNTAVSPDRTVTLALPKTGLVNRSGSLYLADIGLPATVFERLDLSYTNPFGSRPWIHLQTATNPASEPA